MKIFFFLLLQFFSISAFSQISFTTQYGGIADEDGRWMEQTSDSGYVMTGNTETYSNGQSDVWLIKADAFGNLLWQKSFGGSGYDFANMVKITADGGFIIAGLTNSFGAGNTDGYVIKTDQNGNFQWQKTYGNSGLQEIEAIIQTSDGGYAAVGFNYGSGTQYYDMWLLRMDSNGNLLWQKNIGGGSYEIGNSIQQTADNGFILAGQSYSFNTTNSGDFYLVKTDSTGTVQWQKTYGNGKLCEAHYVQIVPNGGYIMVGDADTTADGFGQTDAWVVRTNNAGDTLWTKSYGGDKRDGGKTIEPTSDGGFLLAGITRSFGLINPDYYVVKTDSGGVINWSRNYGLSGHDHAYRAIETSDGGYAIFGYFRSGSFSMNFALVKIGPGGGVTKDISVDQIITPTNIICSSLGSPIIIQLANYGQTNETAVGVTLQVEGPPGIQYYYDTLWTSLLPSSFSQLTFAQLFNSVVPGVYSLKAYIFHRPGDISYTNDTAYSTLTVVAPASDPAVSSAISCTPASLTLSASGSDSLFWYDAPAGGNLVGTGPSFVTPVLASSTTYYVENHKGKAYKTGAPNNFIGTGGYTNSQSGLLFDTRKSFKLISVFVYANSVGPRTIELRDQNDNVIQSYTGNMVVGGQRVYLNFDVPQQTNLKLVLGAGSNDLFRNNSGAAFPYAVSQVIEMFSPTSGGLGFYYYFYDWHINLPYENCTSNRIPVEAIIGNIAGNSFDQYRCGPGTLTFSISSGSTIQWYDDSMAGNLVHTGNVFTTPVLNSSTTYYMQLPSCTSRIAVQAIINSVSTAPVTTDTSRCGPGNVTLNAIAADTVYWYSSSTGGLLLGTGNSFYTPYLNVTTTYYAQAGSICPSARIPASAIINSAAPPTGNNVSACGPASVTLSASASDPIEWYDDPIAGNLVGTGSVFITPVLSQTITYFAQAISNCPSPRTAITAIITLIDTPITFPASHCGPGSLVLSAASIYQISWFDSASGGSLVGTGVNFTTPVLTSSTDYFVEAVNAGCRSQRIPVTATIANYNPPVGVSNYNCGPGSVILSATAQDTVHWFDDATAGNWLGSGNTFTTPVINTTTTYYLQTSLWCPSTRVAVDAVINSIAADPITSGDTSCPGSNLVLYAVAADTILWYDSSGTLVGSGSQFLTPTISTTTTYYAVAGLLCPSNQVPAVAFVYNAPLVNLGPDTLLVSGSSVTLDAGSGFTNYSWNTGDTTQLLIINGISATYCVSVTDSNGCTTNDCIFVDFQTGIVNANSLPVFVYPNPAREFIIVYIDSPGSLICNFTLTDIVGKTVSENRLSHSPARIDVSTLPPGIYFAQISATLKTQQIKLIIY